MSDAGTSVRAAVHHRGFLERRRRDLTGAIVILPWIGPALALISGVVLFPAGYMVFTSFRDISQFGLDRGWAGLENFERVFGLDHLPRVALNTVIWVVAVVVVTVLLSLPLAQLLHQRFPGRRIVRLALIVPWAASVVMTATIFVYGLDPFYGIINQAFVDIGVIERPFGFLKSPLPGFISAALVAVFVSVPFTTYVLLAGLQTVPAELLEAAGLDGANGWSAYRHIVLPILRPALSVATIINIINVFNSLPILRTMTGSIPGYDADTTTTLAFKIIQADRRIDVASALSVVNFVVVLGVILVYLRVVRPMRER